MRRYLGSIVSSKGPFWFVVWTMRDIENMVIVVVNPS